MYVLAATQLQLTESVTYQPGRQTLMRFRGTKKLRPDCLLCQSHATMFCSNPVRADDEAIQPKLQRRGPSRPAVQCRYTSTGVPVSRDNGFPVLLCERLWQRATVPAH